MRFRVFVFLLSVSVIFFLPTYGAEVYYLGSGQSSTDQAKENPSYSLRQRFNDLLDFTSDRSMQERSGRFSGRLLQTIEWNKVSANKQKSFLENGTDFLTELNINLQEKLSGNYNFEGQWFLRKTDNRRIESRKDVRLKQVNLKVFNPNNLFEFGDFYADFSQFALGSSLEGFNIELSPSRAEKYHIITARKNRADLASERFQRNAYGAKIDHFFFLDSALFNNFRMGLQAVHVQDDSSTSYDWGNAVDVDNTVISTDGEITFSKIYSLQYELARSAYIADEDSEVTRDNQFGTAFRFQPALNLGKFNTRYLYYYAQPKFYTDLGSVAADKIQHQLALDYRFNDRVGVNFVENYYWDRLNGSSLTKRTFNDEKYLNFILRPLSGRKSFALRPYFNLLKKNSDDKPINSAESTTHTAGLGIYDSLDSKTSYNLNYEYRSFTDEANRATSDYFHRLSLNLSLERQLLEKRLFLFLSPSVDHRRTKTDDDKDVNLGFSFSGQYDLLKSTIMRFGYNIQDTNASKPDSDFANERIFGEFDYTISQEKSTHFIVRGERNHYRHEDGSQDYNETRIIAKFVSNF